MSLQKDGKSSKLASNLNYIPPQAVDLEEAVLGILLEWNNEQSRKVIQWLDPRIFYIEVHKLIAEAILEVKKESNKIDVLLVAEQLKKDGHGDIHITDLLRLTMKVSSDANLEYYWRILQQKHLQREFIKITAELNREAYEDTTDIFILIEKMEKAIKEINPLNREVLEDNANEIAEIVQDSLVTPQSSGIFMYYDTGWKKFDKYIGTIRNKIVVCGGASGDGKSRFVASWMFKILDEYPDAFSIYWCSFEDSAEDILLFYLSKHLLIKSKDIKNRKFDKTLIPKIQELIDKFKKFDIKFLDKNERIRAITQRFELFVQRRPDKFHILIIDNFLSLKDRRDFKNNDNSMSDYVCAEILDCRQSTRALIIVVHHYNDAQLLAERKKDGFRPTLQDLKGSEGIRRIANQVLLFNNPSKRKDLMTEYEGDVRKNLSRLFIVDPGKIRDDSNVDDESLIYMFNNLDYLVFEEI